MPQISVAAAMPTAVLQAGRVPRVRLGRGAITSGRTGTTASKSAVECLPAAPRPLVERGGQCPFSRSELFGQLRHDLEQIADQADVRDLEDRRLLVLVDGDDRLGILHPGKMLDRARNADRDIDFGRDNLAGLPDLVV